jgi:hypothetical protein
MIYWLILLGGLRPPENLVMTPYRMALETTCTKVQISATSTYTLLSEFHPLCGKLAEQTGWDRVWLPDRVHLQRQLIDSDRALEIVSAVPSLTLLQISDGAKLTPRGLERIRKLPRLEWLLLLRRIVTETDIEQLARNKTLRYLIMNHCRFTPSAIDALAECRLEHLGIHQRRITGDEFAALATARTKWLAFGYAVVDDQMLEIISQNRNVKSLNLWDTIVNEEAVTRLKEQRPEMEIRWRPPQWKDLLGRLARDLVNTTTQVRDAVASTSKCGAAAVQLARIVERRTTVGWLTAACRITARLLRPAN